MLQWAQTVIKIIPEYGPMNWIFLFFLLIIGWAQKVNFRMHWMIAGKFTIGFWKKENFILEWKLIISLLLAILRVETCAHPLFFYVLRKSTNSHWLAFWVTLPPTLVQTNLFRAYFSVLMIFYFLQNSWSLLYKPMLEMLPMRIQNAKPILLISCLHYPQMKSSLNYSLKH